MNNTLEGPMPNFERLMAAADDALRARDIVEAFLVASMVPDPKTAARYIADDVDIHFTGDTRMKHPREMTAYNAARYTWVKKDIQRYDVAPGDGETIVYSIGTLYGEWKDGAAFANNRYVDRFVVVNDKIVRIDVWNDSAERILKGEGQRKKTKPAKKKVAAKKKAVAKKKPAAKKKAALGKKSSAKKKSKSRK